MGHIISYDLLGAALEILGDGCRPGIKKKGKESDSIHIIHK